MMISHVGIFSFLTNTCICLSPSAVYSICYGGNCFLEKRFPGVKNLSFPFSKIEL